MALSYPNEWYPTEEWSLRKFHQTARICLHADHPSALHTFLQLVLAGKAMDDNENAVRVRLVPEMDTPAFDSVPMVLTRDFDSLLGVTYDLPFLRPLSIFPVPNFRDTLKKDNHLYHKVRLPVRVLYHLYTLYLVFASMN
jgi:hypothetical protein